MIADTIEEYPNHRDFANRGGFSWPRRQRSEFLDNLAARRSPGDVSSPHTHVAANSSIEEQTVSDLNFRPGHSFSISTKQPATNRYGSLIRCVQVCGMVLLLSAMAVPADAADVQFIKKADTVEVSIGGDPFAVYNFGKDLPKPFFSPVRGPGGTIISRPIEKPGNDHPHQKGLWVAVDEINEIKFWKEDGRIENVSLEVIPSERLSSLSPIQNKTSSGSWQFAGRQLLNVSKEAARATGTSQPGRMQVVNNWLDEEGKPLLVEMTTISIYPNRLLTYDMTFTARQPVTFGDTKEGMFGFRMVDSMRESDGGHIVNADGLQGSKECWGKQSDWVDYYGPVDGKTIGIAIFDHPRNLRRSRYHVRNYGLFSINPFGESAYTNGEQAAKPLSLNTGESFPLRYAMYIHSGDTQSADVAGAYEAYLKVAK